jgi:CBS domain-containing protein
MQAPPATVPGDLPVLEVIARMTETRGSAAIILADDGRITGILTEQDVTRRIAGHPVGAQAVAKVMTSPVATIRAEQPLYEAIGFMRRLGLRHMPVVDGAGDLCGMLYLHDALAAADPTLVEHIDRLTHETTLEGLREVKAAQVRLAADLFADRVPAPEIQSLISHINNDIYRRVVQLNLDLMRDENWGAPPVAFAAIVMGSGGRGESYLFPDQDNGFILADYPDDQHGRIDPFFIELAERMTTQMDQLGFPLCRGGVMATNPVWRKTARQWRHQVSAWMVSSRRICAA